MFASLRNKSALLLLPLFLLGCNSDEKSAPPKPRPVLTYEVPETASESFRRFSGETKAARSVDLGFELSGRIDAIIAQEGRRYSKNTILAQLDPANANADLRIAEAQALQAIQQLRRTQELLESGNASQADFDSAIASQKATEAKLASAKLTVKYTDLVMPYDGVIAEIPADVNQVVSAGTPVIAIQGNLGMDFEIGVPTNLISRVQDQQKVTIEIRNLTGEKITGIVTKISPIASANTTYPVTISIENSEKIANLRSGLDGEALFDFPNPNSQGLALPSTSIQALPDGSHYVWLVDHPDKPTSPVTRTAVTIGELSGQGEIAILTGLIPGQVVVSKGVNRLIPGMEVTLLKK